MKFFNIDLHISVIADIEKIFKNLGHTIDINYLSNHAWVFGKNATNEFCINQSNWKDISLEMCNKFYQENKTKLEKYDGFIVTHIPMLSMLYKKFDKPIIFVASTRYEYPFTDNTIRWNRLNNFLQGTDNIIFVANNLYDKWYCEQFLDFTFEHIPNICNYTNAVYSNDSNIHVYYSKKLNLTNTNIINKDKLGRYTWTELYKYKSIIHIPYNISTMSIFEQYTANMPLFFPTKEYLLELAVQKLALSELSYTQVLNIENKSLIKYKGNIDPNNTNDINLLKQAIDLADFYNEDMKEVMYFSSLDDLKEKINSTNFLQVSNRMEIHNIERKENIKNKWQKILKLVSNA